MGHAAGSIALAAGDLVWRIERPVDLPLAPLRADANQAAPEGAFASLLELPFPAAALALAPVEPPTATGFSPPAEEADLLIAAGVANV